MKKQILIFVAFIFAISLTSSFGQPCNWTQVVSGDCYRMISGGGGNLFVTRRLDILKSTNNGLNWQNANWTLGIVRDSTSVFIGGTFSNFGTGQLIVSALDNGYWISNDTGNSFIQTGPTGFGCAGNELMSLSNGRVIAAMGGFQRGIYKSEGASNDVWTNKFAGTDPYDFTAANDDTLFSGTQNYLLQSVNSGETWNIIQNQWVVDVEIVGDSLYWIDGNSLGYVSHKNNVAGLIPSPRFNLGPGDILDMKYDLNSNTIVATNIDSGIFISIDKGYNWVHCTIQGAKRYYNILFYQGKAYVGTNVGLYSTDLPTSIFDFHSKINFNIYPNPAHDIIKVRTSNSEKQKLVMYDLFGRELRRWEFENTTSINEEISLAEFKPAIYYISLLSERFTQTIKVVKE